MDHTVVHFEIPADDPERAANFYRGLFGWDIQKMPAGGAGPEYWMVRTVPTDETGTPARPGVNGGLLRRMHAGHPFVNYIGVESVDASAAKAKELGAEIVVPKSPVPGMGWFIWFKDPEGNVMALWETDPKAA
jgi:uncharacterized protein